MYLLLNACFLAITTAPFNPLTTSYIGFPVDFSKRLSLSSCNVISDLYSAAHSRGHSVALRLTYIMFILCTSTMGPPVNGFGFAWKKESLFDGCWTHQLLKRQHYNVG